MNNVSVGYQSNKSVSFQKCGLNEIIVSRNGLPFAGCPLSTTDKKRNYYNTLKALDFVFNNSHGISLGNYQNH